MIYDVINARLKAEKFVWEGLITQKVKFLVC